MGVKLNQRDKNAFACRSQQFYLSLHKLVDLISHLKAGGR
jgi:hypothetical protein